MSRDEHTAVARFFLFFSFVLLEVAGGEQGQSKEDNKKQEKISFDILPKYKNEE